MAEHGNVSQEIPRDIPACFETLVEAGPLIVSATTNQVQLESGVVVALLDVEDTLRQLAKEKIADTAAQALVLESLIKTTGPHYQVEYRSGLSLPTVGAYTSERIRHILAPQELEQAHRCDQLIKLYEDKGKEAPFLREINGNPLASASATHIVDKTKFQALVGVAAGFVEEHDFQGASKAGYL